MSTASSKSSSSKSSSSHAVKRKAKERERSESPIPASQMRDELENFSEDEHEEEERLRAEQQEAKRRKLEKAKAKAKLTLSPASAPQSPLKTKTIPVIEEIRNESVQEQAVAASASDALVVHKPIKLDADPVASAAVASLEKDVAKAQQALTLFQNNTTVSEYANVPVQTALVGAQCCDPLPFMKFAVENAAKVVAMMELGKVETNCINTAMLLESLYYKNGTHPFEIMLNPNTLQVVRTKTERKVQDKKTKEWRKEAVKPFINISTKRAQKWNGQELLGYHCETPFFQTPAFTKWGPTEETGVNGSVGRILDESAGPVQQFEATYSFQMNNQTFNSNCMDKNDDDAVGSWFLRTFIKDVLFKTIISKALGIKEALLMAREHMTKQFKNMDKPIPEKLEDQAAWLIEDFFRIRVEPTPGNSTGLTLKVDGSVHRKLHNKWDEGVMIEEEDLRDYKPPSDMFKEPQSVINPKDKQKRVHRRYTMLIARNTDEVDPEIAKLPVSDPRAYKGAWIEVPFENAAVQGRDNIMSLLLQPTVYENIDKKFGGTMKLRGMKWLTTKTMYDEEMRKGIKPVDPRFCMPAAAGLKGYKGPLDKKRESEERRAEMIEASRAAMKAATGNGDEDEEAAMAAAADAAQAKFASHSSSK